MNKERMINQLDAATRSEATAFQMRFTLRALGPALFEWLNRPPDDAWLGGLHVAPTSTTWTILNFAKANGWVKPFQGNTELLTFTPAGVEAICDFNRQHP